MNEKKMVSVLAIVILVISMAAPMVIVPVGAADPGDWYAIKNGVLTSDTYDLYPYTENSIDVGISKFGEMIAPAGGGLYVGLQYPGYDVVSTYDQRVAARDPFGNEYINPRDYLNGWLCEVRYTHRVQGDRRLVAMAMFADFTTYGGDWLNGHDPNLSLYPYGGRKTTGYATTEPLKILYDGPRMWIAYSVTHLYDWIDSNRNGAVDYPLETWALIDVRITFIFNKDKKEIIILKDIKQTIDNKEVSSPLDVQFSDREEWDLGPTPLYDSYAHFYYQQMPTCYGPEWHMAPGIMKEYYYSYYHISPFNTFVIPVNNIVEDDPFGLPVVNGSLRVYKNGVFMREGVDKDYRFDKDTGTIYWNYPYPVTDDFIELRFKLWKIGTVIKVDASQSPGTGIEHNYDLCQIISSDGNYVGWKAFWPTLSDYTPDGWDRSLEPLVNVDETDMLNEPDIPFVIGEWDFMLGKEYPLQFRGVEVVGLTQSHDAQDSNHGDGNVIDREAKYQLDEVFNPWDLQDVVHKETKRWVEWVSGKTSWTSMYRPVNDVPTAEWDQYCTFSERVYDLTAGRLLNRWDGDYTFTVNPMTGYATITGLSSSHSYKILYSTLPDIADGITGTATLTTNTTKWNTVGNSTMYGGVNIAPSSWMDRLGATHDLEMDIANWKFILKDIATNWTASWSKSWEWNETDFKVYRDEKYVSNLDDLYDPITFNLTTGSTVEATIEGFDINTIWKSLTASDDWHVTWPLDGETLHVLYMNHTLDVTITAQYNARGDWLVLSYTYAYSIWYHEKLMGRYEWTVVGKDAKTVDSAGASLVTAAFKNKQVEIGLAGMDLKGEPYALYIPYVLTKYRSTYGDFRDYFLYPDNTSPGQRFNIKDDWCHTWPVSSSNMISVGGPLINYLTMYFNDFTDAYYSAGWFTPYDAFDNKIVSKTCWNKNTYANTGGETGTGYAVIATYKDINGTVGLVIWGMDGRDTYYATKFFHEELIYELQEPWSDHVTALVIKISYSDPMHPTFSIPEVLGTISEQGGPFSMGTSRFAGWWEYWPEYSTYNYYIYKGGLHDP